MVISLLIEYVENFGACWIMKNKKLVKAKFSWTKRITCVFCVFSYTLELSASCYLGLQYSTIVNISI